MKVVTTVQTLFLAWSSLMSVVLCLRCHQCISRNGDNRMCEAPIPDQAMDCVPFFRSRDQVPQDFSRICIAMRTTGRSPGEQVLIRTCSTDRPPECGFVNFGIERFNGCPLVCSYDGCNSADPASPPLQNNYQLFNDGRSNEKTAGRGYNGPVTRTGARSIISFGKILIALIMTRITGNL